MLNRAELLATLPRAQIRAESLDPISHAQIRAESLDIPTYALFVCQNWEKSQTPRQVNLDNERTMSYTTEVVSGLGPFLWAYNPPVNDIDR